jgi:flagellar hook-associated protein 2
LTQQQKDLQQRQSDVDTRMQALQAQYVKQFSALDTLLSSLQVTSSFLTQQITSLANLNKQASS